MIHVALGAAVLDRPFCYILLNVGLTAGYFTGTRGFAIGAFAELRVGREHRRRILTATVRSSRMSRAL